MKVSNCTIAKITAYTLILMMSMILVSTAFINQTVSDSLCFVAVIILIFILTKIRMVTYEFSGGCITIRKIHPFSFKKFTSPAVEFPQNHIRDYNFDQHIVSASLVLKVRSKRNRKYAVKIKLFGFTYAQRQEISTSLISIVSQNNFEQPT